MYKLYDPNRTGIIVRGLKHAHSQRYVDGHVGSG